jgi:predicted RNase H-like nuclease (RuvC/YqgF family)
MEKPQKLVVKSVRAEGRRRAKMFFEADWRTVEVDEATAQALRGDPLLQVRSHAEHKRDPDIEASEREAEVKGLRAELEAARTRIGELEEKLEDAESELELLVAEKSEPPKAEAPKAKPPKP